MPFPNVPLFVFRDAPFLSSCDKHRVEVHTYDCKSNVMIDAAGHYRVLHFASTLALCQATQYDSPTGVRSHSAARSENCLALHEPEQSTASIF